MSIPRRRATAQGQPRRRVCRRDRPRAGRPSKRFPANLVLNCQRPKGAIRLLCPAIVLPADRLRKKSSLPPSTNTKCAVTAPEASYQTPRQSGETSYVKRKLPWVSVPFRFVDCATVALPSPSNWAAPTAAKGPCGVSPVRTKPKSHADRPGRTGRLRHAPVGWCRRFSRRRTAAED
jgi:hypothetical protein